MHLGDECSHKETSSKQNENIDLCTPFCVCGCCGTSMILNFQIHYLIAKANEILFGDELIRYNMSMHSIFFSNIWQPPKL
jgi:hypothetical protein